MPSGLAPGAGNALLADLFLAAETELALAAVRKAPFPRCRGRGDGGPDQHGSAVIMGQTKDSLA